MKQGIVSFIKDGFWSALIYFSTFFLIVLFFRLTSEGSIELIYPLKICLIGFGIIVLSQLFRYIRYFVRLPKSIDNPGYDLVPATHLQYKSAETIGKIHRSYIGQFNELNAAHIEQNRFISQWVHHLKTPITVIDLLTQGESYTEETLQSISEENELLKNNVEQLLSLLRLGEFAKDFVPEEINLVEEMRTLINSMKKQFIIHHVHPELRSDSERVIIFSDRKWNRLLIEQFITNAIKYSKKVEVESEGETFLKSQRITITVTEDEGQVTLCIQDNGIGIPEYDLPRIFEPFFTGDNGRNHQGASGIGLYIAETIANKLHHRIEVTSEVGISTTVMIHYNLSKL